MNGWRTGMYVHPGMVKPGILRRIWLRLCPFIVEGDPRGLRGFFFRSRAYDCFYDLSSRVADHRSVNMLQKSPFQKVTML